MFYQSPDGSILESEHLDGLWSEGPSRPRIFKDVLFTPLAAIDINGGKEISGPEST